MPLPLSRDDVRHSRCRPSRGFRATRRLRARPAIRSTRAPRSALDLRVVVHDAEHAAAAVAVAGQRGVAVDPVADVAAAVDELADAPATAAVPGAVDPRAEAELAAGARADARARCGRERVPVGIAQQHALRVQRATELVDRAAEVVYRLAVGGPEREALRVDPRQPDRVLAGAGREDVAAEVVGLRLLGPQRIEHEAPARDRHEQPSRAGEEAAPRALAG